MKIFRYIHLIIFLWFSNEVKASVSVDSSVGIEISGFVSSLFSLKSQNKFVLFPFKSKIIFRTFYNFDLEFCQNYEIRLDRRGRSNLEWEKREILSSFTSVSTSKIYTCKNNWTSFIPKFSFSISKRTMIKKISRRVDLYFDFSMPLLFFRVALLTKDGERFRFFHVPECANENDEDKRGRPFRLYFPLRGIRSAFLLICEQEDVERNGIKSIDKFSSYLYFFASCFSFCFDNIKICPYLFFYIIFPIKGVFSFFYFFIKYLFLRAECKELEKLSREELDDEKREDIIDKLLKKEGNCEDLRDKMKGYFLSVFLSMFNFSIRF